MMPPWHSVCREHLQPSSQAPEATVQRGPRLQPPLLLLLAKWWGASQESAMSSVERGEAPGGGLLRWS